MGSFHKKVVPVCSKDSIAAGVPVWETLVDFDSFVASHISWQLQVVELSCDTVFLTEFLNDPSASMRSLLQSLEDFFNSSRSESRMHFLGYHASSDEMTSPFGSPVDNPVVSEFTKIAVVVAHEPGSQVESFWDDSVPLAYIQNDALFGLHVALSVSKHSINLDSIPSLVRDFSFKTVDSSVSHLWLHEIFYAVNRNVANKFSVACFLAVPEFFASMLEFPGLLNVGDVRRMLSVSSQDLSQTLNEYRFVSASLIETVSAAELHDAVIMLTGVDVVF